MTDCLKVYDTKIAQEPGQRWVLARISTATVDNEGDVVLPSGGDFTEFEKNPTVMFRHGLGEGDKLPIGQVFGGILRRTNDLVAKVFFAQRPTTHPPNLEWIADTVHELYKQGVMRAFSMGFRILMGGARPAESRDLARFGDGARRIITKWRLKEISAVPFGMHPEALAMAVSKGWMATDSWVAKSMGWPQELLDTVDPRPMLRVDEPTPIRLD